MRVTILTCDGSNPLTPEVRLNDNYRETSLLSWADVDLGDAEWHEQCDRGAYGAGWAPWHAMNAGFAAGHDFVIVTNDDTTVSPDVMEFFRWTEAACRDMPFVGSISAYNPGTRDLTLDTYRDVPLWPWFVAGCWGTWRSRWERIIGPTWDGDELHKGSDWHLAETVYPENGLHEAKPTWSRAQNIGAWGVHMRPGLLESHEAHPWAGDITQPPDTEWRIV